MSDYQSRYSGPQIDNMLDAVNNSLVTPGSTSDPTLVGYRYSGIAVPSTQPDTTGAKIFYIASQPGTYTNFGGLTVGQDELAIFKKNYLGNWMKESIESLDALNTFYIVCSSAGDASQKSITLSHFVLTTSIRLLVKMTNVNTSSSVVTFSVNSDNVANLYYNGSAVSAANTWKANEVLDIFFDGTNYQAYPIAIPIVQTTGQDPQAVMSQKAVTDELIELQNKVFPVEVGFDINAIGVQEYTGMNLTKTLSWSVSRKDSPEVPRSVLILQEGSVIENISNPSQANGTKDVIINKLGTTHFAGTFIADGLSVHVEKNVKQVLPCYIGFYAAGATANTMKDFLIKRVVDSVVELSGSYRNYNAGYSLIIMIPDTMDITLVTSSGLEVPMLDPVTDNTIHVGGSARAYKVYRSASETGINTGKMILNIH